MPSASSRPPLETTRVQPACSVQRIRCWLRSVTRRCGSCRRSAPLSAPPRAAIVDDVRQDPVLAPTSHTFPTHAAPPVVPRLTPRETEILYGLTQGWSTSTIARMLVLSPRTVERHLSNLYLKLGVHSRAEAIALAFRADLVSQPQS